MLRYVFVRCLDLKSISEVIYDRRWIFSQLLIFTTKIIQKLLALLLLALSEPELTVRASQPFCGGKRWKVKYVYLFRYLLRNLQSIP